jgi:catechol 2,3-dioxygenase-like lactoylglutathione lyase family enzyme
MKLNHLNLTVPDVVASREFFEKYFGLRGGGGNQGMQVVYDDDGLVLTLIRGKPSEITYPSTFHVGFIQPTEQAVNEVNQRLRDDGFDVPPPSRQHGSWTFYFRAPGGFTIEVLG